MAFADLSGVRMHYELAGTGPRLMFANGTGSDLRHKPNVFAGPLAQHFELLAFDHRGLGQSEPTDPDHQPTMAHFANDALALATHVGWESFAVMGVSFGGMVAQEVAIRGGDRITRLVLACTSSGGPGNPSYPLHEVYAQAPEKVATDMVALMDTRTITDSELRAQWEKIMLRQERPAVTPPGLKKQLEARRWHDTWDRLPSVTAPTMVAAGEFDNVAPLVNTRALHSQIPNSELSIFDGGHVFMYQDPSALPAIINFLLEES